ncbi:nuclease domain-containing protein [Methanobrevibacter sp.]|uniref:nuclease domain-containing protein n=1 Tax=Methanobrevibacter sp. TaxID=66852 RepID=UPI00388E6047
MFEMGFKLNWSEVTNEFKGNEKKLFELYEYWCYFELIDVLNQISINTIDFSDIFDKVKDEDKDEFSISLKHNLLNTFYINVGDRSIEVDLTYNRSFYRTSNEFKSYSVTLRPDYSLIVRDGEKEHILHFDAKYKLYIDSESFKNEDIVKMHAYKDAIVGTVGAYVLYPGEKKRLYYEHLDDKLESVGAFPLSPGENKYNRDYLRDFILSMIHKLIEN